MARYSLGIDVGSTKTHALLADESGQAIGFGTSGPGNPEGVGYDGLAKVLQEATDGAISSAGISRGEIAGAGFGVGGYDWPSQLPDMLGSIGTLELSAPVEVVNDAVLGLLAGAEQGWGVAVVSGTSCNACGRDRAGREGRMTGFSWLGEYAGAGELVAKALRAVALAWTQRAPATALTDAFVKEAGVRDVEGLLEALTIGDLRIGSSSARTVFQVAADGDQVAIDLVLWAGRELADMAIGVIRQLGIEEFSFEVVLAGSFFKGSPFVAETLHESVLKVAPGATQVWLRVPPVVGAVVLGMQQCGIETPPLRARLIESAEESLSTGG